MEKRQMTAREFVDKFTGSCGEPGKILVCHAGLAFVKRNLEEGRSIRWFASDEAEREFRRVSSFALAWSIMWALKEYALVVGMGGEAIHALVTHYDTLAGTPARNQCRDVRWHALVQAFKIVGITHYSA